MAGFGINRILLEIYSVIRFRCMVVIDSNVVFVFFSYNQQEKDIKLKLSQFKLRVPKFKCDRLMCEVKGDDSTVFKH